MRFTDPAFTPAQRTQARRLAGTSLVAIMELPRVSIPSPGPDDGRDLVEKGCVWSRTCPNDLES